jgi:hypothetical protein
VDDRIRDELDRRLNGIYAKPDKTPADWEEFWETLVRLGDIQRGDPLFGAIDSPVAHRNEHTLWDRRKQARQQGWALGNLH